MPFLKRFEDLDAWKAARALTNGVYEMTSAREFRKDFGLRDQIRRASLSVMNNIAEGFDSGSRTEFARFLSYARRSGSEVQSCLYVAVDRGYCAENVFRAGYERAERCRGLVNGLIRYLRNAHHQTRLHVCTSTRLHDQS